MNMIKITLEDKIYQGIIREISDMQINQMIDKKEYGKEIQALRKRLNIRYNQLINQAPTGEKNKL